MNRTGPVSKEGRRASLRLSPECYASIIINLSTAPMYIRPDLKSKKLWVLILAAVSTLGAWVTGEINAFQAITAINGAAAVYMGAQGYVDGKKAEAAKS